jgi:hypothetical protein
MLPVAVHEPVARALDAKPDDAIPPDNTIDAAMTVAAINIEAEPRRPPTGLPVALSRRLLL